MTKKIYTLLAVSIFVLGGVNISQAGLINGGFEFPVIPDNSFGNVPEGTPGLGWQTTASDNMIEIWNEPFLGVDAYEGEQFAELNANEVSNLYQEISGIAVGAVVGWEFAHRGRDGVDTIGLEITDLGVDNVLGGGDDTLLFSNTFSDGNTAWGFYQGTGIVALGNNIRFSWISVSSTSGIDPYTYGNFLDAAAFGVGEGGDPVPEPATMLLFGAGMAGLAGLRLRKK